MDREKMKKELDSLIEEGRNIFCSGVMEYNKNYFENADEKSQKIVREAVKKIKNPKRDYYVWYDKAYRAVQVFTPERLAEFERFYTGSKNVKKTADLDPMTAGITHYLQGWTIPRGNETIDFFHTFTTGFTAQRFILQAIGKNVDHVLFNLEAKVQYELSKSEIDSAKNLKKIGQLRASGAIVGVVIERHLKIVMNNRDIKLNKRNPTISKYNDVLKDVAYDAKTEKIIQMCGRIRNNCVHHNDAEPTADEIDAIISSAEIIIAQVN